jgi:hypothetical protein
MKSSEWVRMGLEDREAFLAHPLPLPPDVAAGLREQVALILDEAMTADEMCAPVAALAAAVRGVPVEPPDLLGRARLGELLPLLVTRTMRSGEVPDALFEEALAAMFNHVGARLSTMKVVEAALGVALRLNDAGRPIHEPRATWSPGLILVSRIAYQWPLWSLDADDHERARAAASIVDAVRAEVDGGRVDALFAPPAKDGHPDGVPRAAPPPPPSAARPPSTGQPLKVEGPGVAFQVDKRWTSTGHWMWDVGHDGTIAVELADFERAAPSARDAYGLFLANKPHLGEATNRRFSHPLGLPSADVEVPDLGVPVIHRYVFLQGARRLVVCRLTAPNPAPPEAVQALHQVAQSVRLSA